MKAKGWIVKSNGFELGLCKPANGQTVPSGVEKVLFITSKPTMFPDRKSAQRAIDNRNAFDKLNHFDKAFADARIVTLYEA